MGAGIAIRVDLRLQPPTDIDPNAVKSAAGVVSRYSSASHPMATSSIESTLSDLNAYYTAASAAVLLAQKDLNEKLTAWKEAIGDREKNKEDAGQVAYGRGKAARMMKYAAREDKGQVPTEVSEEEEDDDDEE